MYKKLWKDKRIHCLISPSNRDFCVVFKHFALKRPVGGRKLYRLLLLEDEVEIGSTLEMILRSENYHIDWFTTGDEAVNAAVSNDYDLMILDVMLKKTVGELNTRISNGLEVARLVNQKENSIFTPDIKKRTARYYARLRYGSRRLYNKTI